MIRAEDLIAKFQYALDNKWGYIWGTSGQVWTQRDQNNSSREMTVKYGSKWIGHTVADCSGLFRWAYRQLGTDCAHGSNSIYKNYCSAKGTLKAGRRTDGQELKPGTAVFTGDAQEHGHIGLYIGGGDVIEAAGTQQGVIRSKVTDKKWTYWGELKAVAYTDVPEPTPEPGYAIVTGKKVALRQEPSTRATVIMRINTGESVKIEEAPQEWEYVSYNGRKGWMMKEFLNKG